MNCRWFGGERWMARVLGAILVLTTGHPAPVAWSDDSNDPAVDVVGPWIEVPVAHNAKLVGGLAAFAAQTDSQAMVDVIVAYESVAAAKGHSLEPADADSVVGHGREGGSRETPRATVRSPSVPRAQRARLPPGLGRERGRRPVRHPGQRGLRCQLGGAADRTRPGQQRRSLQRELGLHRPGRHGRGRRHGRRRPSRLLLAWSDSSTSSTAHAGVPMAFTDGFGHGTHVAGMIGATGASSSQPAKYQGVATQAGIVALRVLDAQGQRPALRRHRCARLDPDRGHSASTTSASPTSRSARASRSRRRTTRWCRPSTPSGTPAWWSSSPPATTAQAATTRSRARATRAR